MNVIACSIARLQSPSLSVLLCAFLVFSTQAAVAQTVANVTGSKAVVQLEENNLLKVGDEVKFIDKNSHRIGEGKVLRFTPSGNQAIVQIGHGKIFSGMKVVKRDALVAENPNAKESKPLASEPADEKPGVETEVRGEGNTRQTSPKAERMQPTSEESAILDRGEINGAAYVIGAILGTYPLGFGIGHAIQGRYKEMGYIFTIGELGSLGVMMAGGVQCVGKWSGGDSCDGTLLTLGAVGFLGFKVWEIIDLWVTPLEINSRYRRVHARFGNEVSLSPTLQVVPGGGLVGMQMRF